MASALGLVRVARHDVQDETAMEYLEKIEDSAAHLDVLVSNIIDFYKNSREQSSVEELEFEPLIEDVIESVQSHLGTDDALIDAKIDQQNRFKADVFRLRVILSNLISNAIKFQKDDQEKVRVNIEITSDLNEAHIKVQDDGVGIIQEHMNRIFEIFFKGNNPQSGSGIGLYIVKEALEKMDGTIEVESKMGEGTLFSIKIPNQI
ncbi:MAG: HAMP domain-containing sensor histidine kinase [Owenweeksia sp.]|nr:HAMP domain-containing sensor histidine kinase [Owenweeksia sp.]